MDKRNLTLEVLFKAEGDIFFFCVPLTHLFGITDVSRVKERKVYFRNSEWRVKVNRELRAVD